MAVSTGHLSPEEGLTLAREAKKMGIKKLIFCHPDSKTVGAQMEHIKEMAGMNFFVEFTFLGLLPAFYRISIQEVVKRIKEIGAQRSILTTDFFFEWASPPFRDDAHVYQFPFGPRGHGGRDRPHGQEESRLFAECITKLLSRLLGTSERRFCRSKDVKGHS